MSTITKPVESSTETDPINSVVIDTVETDVMIGFNEWMAVVECSYDALEGAI